MKEFSIPFPIGAQCSLDGNVVLECIAHANEGITMRIVKSTSGYHQVGELRDWTHDDQLTVLSNAHGWSIWMPPPDALEALEVYQRLRSEDP